LINVVFFKQLLMRPLLTDSMYKDDNMKRSYESLMSIPLKKVHWHKIFKADPARTPSWHQKASANLRAGTG
jgi:hypothetical protein